MATARLITASGVDAFFIAPTPLCLSLPPQIDVSPNADLATRRELFIRGWCI